jgi:hypothetical protein
MYYQNYKKNTPIKRSGIKLLSKEPLRLSGWLLSRSHGFISIYITEYRKSNKQFTSQRGIKYVVGVAVKTVKDTGQKSFEFGLISLSGHYGRFNSFKFTTNKGGRIW